MTYLDEEARHDFHKCNTLLQVIVSMAETALARQHLQLEVIECEGPQIARIGIREFEPGDLEFVKGEVHSLNKQFRRKDDVPTIAMIDLDHGILSFYVTEPHDLLTLQ